MKKALLDTFYFLYTNCSSVLQRVWIPSLVIIACNWMISPELTPLISFSLSTLSILSNVYIAIAIHRFIILGPDFARPWGIGKWTPIETAFFGKTILAMIITIFPFMILAGILSSVFNFSLEITFSVFIQVGLYFMARIALIFPSIAVGNPIRLRDSWDISGNHHSLVFVLVFLVPSLLFFPIQFLPQDTVWGILVSIYSCMAVIFTIALLSKTYNLCIQQDHRGNDHPADCHSS